MLRDFPVGSSLANSVRKAEHFQISSYGSLCSWAKELELAGALSILKEKEQTDEALTLLAESSRNREAARHDSPKKTEEEAGFLKGITHAH